MAEPAPKPTDAAAPAEPKPASHPGLKLLLELGPLALFFFAYSKWDIFVATGVLMVTAVISVAVTRVTEKRWPVMPLVTAVLALVLGGLTIWLHDETFLKIKVTAINALFGATLLVGMLMGKRFLRLVFGEALQLTAEGWTVLTKLWTGYFFAIAALNEVVWRNTTTDAWVKFKVIGLPVLSLVFIVAQGFAIAKHDASEQAPRPDADPKA